MSIVHIMAARSKAEVGSDFAKQGSSALVPYMRFYNTKATMLLVSKIRR